MMDAKNYIFLLFPIECVSPLRYTLSMFYLLIHLKAILCFPYTAKGSISSAIGPRPTPFSLYPSSPHTPTLQPILPQPIRLFQKKGIWI